MLFVNMRGIHSRKDILYNIDVNNCWVWQRSLVSSGYGVLMRDRKRYLAHRYMYEKHKGKIPEGMQIDHLCRNRACINPDHLEAVTQNENARRGKQAKLNKKDISEIREQYKNKLYTQKQLAIKFNVNQSSIQRIVTLKRWKDV